MTKVALYCRVSKSDGSQDTQRQVDDLTAFCQEKNWQIVDAITENVSGRRKQREGTKRLINLARANQITKVLIHAVNRLGRNLADTFNTIEALSQEKVSVYVYTQKQETLDEFGNKTPFATLVMPVLAGMAEDWTRQHSESIKSGQRRSKKKPGRPTGKPIKKENDIFNLLQQRTPEREISRQLGISRETVKKVRLKRALELQQIDMADFINL